MQCPRCQHANSPVAKFCEECATPLTRMCAQCGSRVSPTAKFCPECTYPVSGAAGGQPRFAAPGSSTPKHLAEKILMSKSALEGCRSPAASRPSWPRASTAWRPRTSAYSRPPPSSARTCPSRYSWPSPTRPSRRCGALGRLGAAEFLYETRLFPDLEYTFKHALTHEVAYGSLLHDRRRELHARIAWAIESLSPDRRAEQLERLAHHFFHGELWDRAVTSLRETGLKALARSAHREAIIHFEHAVSALQRLPDTERRERSPSTCGWSWRPPSPGRRVMEISSSG